MITKLFQSIFRLCQNWDPQVQKITKFSSFSRFSNIVSGTSIRVVLDSMSRESNLTRLWLKWVESESSRPWKSRIWVESESNHADCHLSQSWVNWTVAQPGFHFGGGGQSSGSGPPGITGPRFSLSAASVGPRYLLRVHERGVIRPPGVWLLIEPGTTLYM